MDITTIVLTALNLAMPFINKTGEGITNKIGEDIWNLIKKPFSKKGENIDNLNLEQVKEKLSKILKEDSNFKEELQKFINSVESKQSIVSQNIQNNGSIDKQVNIGNVTGDINL